MENKELDMKDSICLDNDFRKWIIACDKLDEGINVSDPEMQKHIDTYEKHLEKENAPHAPGATTDVAALSTSPWEEKFKSIKELQAPAVPGQTTPTGTMGSAGMGTPAYARQGQQGGMQVQPSLPQNPGDNIAQLKKMAADAMRNPQMRAMPQVQNMINLINQLK